MNQKDTFRTHLTAVHADFDIQHSHALLCMGSCFAEHIGDNLLRHKFSVSVNPAGILFNPHSIADSLQRMLHPQQVEEDSLFFNEGCWNSYAYHSCFSHPDKQCCLQQIQQRMAQAHDFLQRTDFLFITLGSNVVYRLKSSGEVVANCHRMPSGYFEKQAMDVEDMKTPLEQALQEVRALRPELRVILTVSPVRYIRNDFTENSYSKACLRVLAHDLCHKYAWISYFPAFEILMDDLRDYRFYASDRIHPSEEAVAYIWDYFSDTYFTEESLSLNRQTEAVYQAFHHRPAFPQTEAYRQFCLQSLEKIKNIQTLYSFLDFSEERTYFEQFIQ